jgi:4-amino-4-deoxy-L-arabinose transferase-like glycosyltransferase
MPLGDVMQDVQSLKGEIRKSFLTILHVDEGAFLGVVVFLMIYALLGLAWMINDQYPPVWDPAQYLDASVSFYRTFSSNLGEFLRLYKNVFNGAKAPLISLLPLPSYILFGPDDLVLKSWMAVLMVLFVLVSYWLFRQFFKNWIALYASILLSLMPMNVAMSRNYFAEYPLTLWSMLWMIGLLKSNYLRSTRVNLFLGVLLGTGLLLKVNFPLYAGPPAVIFLLFRVFLIWKETGGGIRQSLIRSPLRQLGKDLAFIIIPAALLASSWYWFNLRHVLSFGLSSAYGSISQSYSLGNSLDPQTLLTYGLVLVNTAVSPYIFFLTLFLLLLSGMMWVGRKPLSRITQTIEPDEARVFGHCRNLAVALWFLVPLITLSLATNKLPRFVEPVMPVIALGAASALEFLVRTQRQRILVGSISLVFPVFALAYWSLPINCNCDLVTGQIEWLRSQTGYARAISNDQWYVRDIVRLIKQDLKEHTPPAGSLAAVLITSNNPYFNHNTFNYYAQLEGLGLGVAPTYGGSESDWLNVAKGRIERAPYIIAKPGGLVWLYNSDQVLSSLESGALAFAKIASFDLPDGTRATIYRRNYPSGNGSIP